MIKVAMIVRSSIYDSFGGDTVQVLQTAHGLREFGYAADIRLAHEKIDYNNYQLLHFFNIGRPADILRHVSKTKTPFAVSTILVDYAEYDKNHRKGLPGFVFRRLGPGTIEYLKTIGRIIRRTDRLGSLSYLWHGQQVAMRKILSRASLLLPNSFSEYRRVKAAFPSDPPFMVVPNAVNGRIFRFNNKSAKDSKLVLCVARLEGLKNQLSLIRALNNTDYKLVLIGASSLNQARYAEQCRKEAGANVTFIEHLPQEELVSYYQLASVHVLPSWFETTGLSSIEATVMHCNIVITDKGDTRDYFGNDAVYCDPGSPESILTAVEKASAAPFNEGLLNRILNNHTWQQAAQQTLKAYQLAAIA